MLLFDHDHHNICPYFNYVFYLEQKISSLTQCSTWEEVEQKESKATRSGGSASGQV